MCALLSSFSSSSITNGSSSSGETSSLRNRRGRRAGSFPGLCSTLYFSFVLFDLAFEQLTHTQHGSEQQL
jgi:hypothetical protein